MRKKYIAVGDKIHIPSMTGTIIMESMEIAKLLNRLEKLEWKNCPECGGESIGITRGLPSRSFCKKYHYWEREK